MDKILPTPSKICFLVGMIFLLACNRKSADQDAAAGNSHSVNTNISPPSTYASQKEGWLVNLDEAYARSVKEKKPILANFTGSDWNGWCKRLDTDVLSTPTFKTWAEKNVVLLEVDFPKRMQLPAKNKEQNDAMAQSLNVTEYPTIWLLHVTHEPQNGRFKVQPIGKTGYHETPEAFIGAVQGLLLR